MVQGNPSSVANLSTIMAWLSTCGFFLIPIIVIYAFLEPDRSRWLMFDMPHVGGYLKSTVPLPLRLTALCCTLVPTAFTMWALWSLRRLFLLYARGSVFSPEALEALNNVAAALFASVVVAFISQAPVSLALTWANGPGHRLISLGLGWDDTATLFLAGVVLVISRVMREAQRMADENAKFV